MKVQRRELTIRRGKPTSPPPAPVRVAQAPLGSCKACGAEVEGTNPDCPLCCPPAESRVRTFVLSNETPDRYNTVFRADGWQLDNYQRNPVVLWAHDRSHPAIGKGTARVVGTELLLDVEFFDANVNALAEQLLRTIDAGVGAISVGFEPLEAEYATDRETGDEFQDYFYPPLDYTRTELLEASIVNVPGNAEALPVGRSAPGALNDKIAKRFRERFLQRTPPAAPPPPPPAPPEPGPLTPSAEELRAAVARITAEVLRDRRAQDLRRLGSTSTRS
jgi:hypothetical protein